MKCDIQTVAALKIIRCVFDLGPHMKVADLKKMTCAVQTDKNKIWVTNGQKSWIWATFSCSVNKAIVTAKVQKKPDYLS